MVLAEDASFARFAVVEERRPAARRPERIGRGGGGRVRGIVVWVAEGLLRAGALVAASPFYNTVNVSCITSVIIYALYNTHYKDPYNEGYNNVRLYHLL